MYGRVLDINDWNRRVFDGSERSAGNNNRYATALLEDCRHLILSMPPKMFDALGEHNRSLRTIIERLNHALRGCA